MNIATGLYAFLLLIGGAIGYLKAGSNMSLFMGTISALVFAVLGLQKGRTADYATLGLAGLMTIFFSYRFYVTQNFFPSGIIILASLALFLWVLRKGYGSSAACCQINKSKVEN